MPSPTNPNQGPLPTPGPNSPPTGRSVDRGQIPPSSQASPIPHNALRTIQSRTEFLQSLETWKNDPTITPEEKHNRTVAADKILRCYDTQGTSLNLSKLSLTSLPNLGALTALRSLELTYNKLTSIDLRGLTALTNLYIDNNELASISLEGMTALKQLSLQRNNLTSIDLRGLTALTKLYLGDNLFISINLEGLTALTELNLSYNQLTTIDLRGLTALTNLYIENNELASINLEGMTALKQLRLERNKLTSIDLQGLNGLEDLILKHNRLTSFADITLPDSPNALQFMYLKGNSFTALPSESSTVTMRIPSGVIQDIPEADLPQYGVEIVPRQNRAITTPLQEILTQLCGNRTATPNLLDHEGAPALAKFLERMRMSWPRYDSTLRSFIHLAEKNPNFREELFEGVVSTETACHDRPLYFFSRMSVTAAAYAAEENNDPKALVQSLIALKYLDLIDAHARDACQGEALEVALYLQLQLRSTLNLPIAIESMAFDLYAQRAITNYLTSHPEQPQTVSEWIDLVATQALRAASTQEQQRKILCDTPYFYKRCEQKTEAKHMRIIYAAAANLLMDSDITTIDGLIDENDFATVVDGKKVLDRKEMTAFLEKTSFEEIVSLAKSSLPKELRNTPFKDLTDAQKNESLKQLTTMKDAALHKLTLQLMGTEAQELIKRAE